MPTNIYVDTNIVIDICDIKRPEHHASLSLVQAYLKEGRLFINSDTLATLFYVLRNRVKFSLEETLERMYFVYDIFTVVAVDEHIFLQGLQLCSSGTSSDYEDAVQYMCAKKINADVIVTNDQNFVSEDIEIVRTRA